MKIRNKIMLTFMIMICFYFVVSQAVRYDMMNHVVKHIDSASQKMINDVLTANKDFFDTLIISYAKNKTKEATETSAVMASAIFYGSKDFNYEKIRNNKELREAVSRDITSINGKVVGYTQMYDIRGMSVINPQKQYEGKNLLDIDEIDPDARELIKKSLTLEKSEGTYDISEKYGKENKIYALCIRLNGTPFIVSSYFNVNNYSNFFYDIINSQFRIIAGNIRDSMYADTSQIIWDLEFSDFAVGAVLIILSIFFALWTSGSITKPLTKLCEEVTKIGSGNFDVKLAVPKNTPVEVRELAGHFNDLGGQLKSYMHTLEKEIESRKNMENEIKIAREIQESYLPKKTMERDEVDLCAALLPAKGGVCGDFYDYFFVNDEIMAVIIADVSGEGIPAALFMNRTINPLRHYAGKFPLDPGLALTRTNTVLVENNKMCMFVTAFLAYYNINTGHLYYANAGHEEAIQIDSPEKPVGFGSFGDVPLGISQNYVFNKGETTINKGEYLLLYTDGATDAVSGSGELFGKERLCKVIKESSYSSAKELCEAVNSSISGFQGEDQSDDITLMALHRKN